MAESQDFKVFTSVPDSGQFEIFYLKTSNLSSDCRYNISNPVRPREHTPMIKRKTVVNKSGLQAINIPVLLYTE